MAGRPSPATGWDTCTAEFERLAAQVGGIGCRSHPFVTVRSPLSLDNASLAVIELLLVAGAAAGLAHAIRSRRRTGELGGLVVWCSGVLCLLLIEPIAYFPQWFGLERSLGLTFVHNQFSVQFLYDRLPLYIVAMYPAFAYPAYLLVQHAGVASRRGGAVLGAACTAFVFHCFYEVIDQVGPQLGWWVWNYDAPSGLPRFGAVPYLNLQAFAIGIPFGIALLTPLVARLRPRWGPVRRVLAVSFGTWPVLFLSSLPSVVIDLAGGSVAFARITGTWLLVAATGLAAAWALSRPGLRPSGADAARFLLVSGGVYLAVAAAIWAYALPGYLGARHGLTSGGLPTGVPGYAAGCAVICVLMLASVLVPRRAGAVPPDRRDPVR
ncbi:hypothetical protein [Actinocorallia longicatena]|uniref:Uncharacterized protein n=1 Tax=Actinocorallia longicatena TaxID=111803 RepID=A0ABP6Q6C1_9ACTN